MSDEQLRKRVKGWLPIMLAVSSVGTCAADVIAVGPTPPVASIPSPPWTRTVVPFFIVQAGGTSMRYQQIYRASLFTNVAVESIYITSFRFNLNSDTNLPIPNVSDWTNVLQLNFSTTQRAVDDLNTNFTENVGPDDTVVLGPAQQDFPRGIIGTQIFFDRPFRYNPAQGNLLFDVRVLNATGTVSPFQGCVCLLGVDTPTDEVSRVWATNVTAATATGSDTIGLFSAFQFSPVPSLQIEFRSVFGTNRPVLTWPAQPSVFVPQTSAQFGNNAEWRTITNGILGTPAGPVRAIYLPTPSAGTSGFYRLLWESGQPVQPSTVPDIPAKPREPSQTK